jgi:ABC-2 type transport system permease protein
MRIWAIILRILRQFRRDKRTLALMLIAPLFVLTLMNIVFNGSEYEPRLGSIHTPQMMNEQFKELGATVLTYETRDAAENALDKREIDAIVEPIDATLQVKLEGSEPSVNKAVIQLIQKMGEGLKSDTTSSQVDITFLHGSENMTSIDQLGPILIGFFIFFFVFLIAGVSFLRERTTGTLERLLSTPLKRWEIVLGYTGGFGLFTIIQAVLISWFSIKVLGILMAGSFLFVLLVTLLISMTALTLGTLISAYANNELQMIQFIPLIIVPQLFLSGIFPLDTLPDWLRQFSVIMPLTYGAHALTNVMIRGKGWDAIGIDVYALIGFSLLFIVLNILALRKHRKI